MIEKGLIGLIMSEGFMSFPSNRKNERGESGRPGVRRDPVAVKR